MTGRAMGSLAMLALLTGWVCAEEEALPPPPDEPLCNEDIVRMVLAGESEAHILEAIEEHPADFDLSDDVVAELEVAGVPAPVVKAMRLRQGAAPVVPRGVDEATSSAGGSTGLEVRFLRDALIVPRTLDPTLTAELEIPPGENTIGEIAVFVACRTAAHVPDQWRSKTPLGGERADVLGRHEMLAFRSGGERRGKDWRLPLADPLLVPLAPADRHDLVMGVAVRAAGRFFVLAAVPMAEVRVPQGSRRSVEARISGATARRAPRIETRIADDPNEPEVLARQVETRPGIWSKGARRPEEPEALRRKHFNSPDGRLRVTVDGSRLLASMEGGPSAQLDLPFPLAASEFLLSPDGGAVAITGRRPGGAWAVAVTVLAQGLPRVVDVGLALSPELEEPCAKAAGKADLGALTWIEPSQRLLVVRRVPPDGACPSKGTLRGLVVSIPGCTVLARYTELELRARFKHLLGDLLGSTLYR